jgi:hypothetical protein
LPWNSTPPQPPSASAPANASTSPRGRCAKLKIWVRKRANVPLNCPSQLNFLYILGGFETFLCPPKRDS